MAIKWVSSSKGIRYYEHPSRKYGKRPDRYYSLTYKLDGKVKCEGLGWESENRVPGESLQNRGERLLAQLRENQRTGQGPRTLTEMRDEGAKKREAEKAQADAETRLLRSLDDFFESEFKPFAARSLKEKSARSEFSLYRLWIQPLIGNKPLVNITLADWSELVKNMMGKCSPRSIEYATGVLRRILKRAEECGHTNLAIPSKKQLGIRAVENRRLRVLSPKECRAILDALKDRDPCAYRLTFFAMLTGCRAGEAIALKWFDISFELDTICFRATKNGEDRIVPMSASVHELLSSFGPGAPDGLVFPKGRGGGMYKQSPEAFRHVVRELGLNTGREKRDRVVFHSLRHTAATHLAGQVDVRNLMDILGWRQISMAARYLHGDQDQKKAALDIMGKNFMEQQQPATIIQFKSQNGA